MYWKSLRGDINIDIISGINLRLVDIHAGWDILSIVQSFVISSAAPITESIRTSTTFATTIAATISSTIGIWILNLARIYRIMTFVTWECEI